MTSWRSTGGTQAATATAKTPESFATEQYFGINAFGFTNKAGETRFIRYVAEPLPGFPTSIRRMQPSGRRIT